MNGNSVQNARSGPAALITGAGSGIGRAIARALAAAGWTVAVNDVRGDAADETVAELRAGGADAVSVIGDIASIEGARAVVAAATEQLGELSGLVNNAAILRTGTLAQLQPEDWDLVLNVNVMGAVHMTHAAWASLARTRGAIVNISSVAAFAPSPAVGAYAASKAAIRALTAQAALEGGPLGIRANAVAPGFISGTGMTNRGIADPERDRRLAVGVPLRRTGRPDDVADAVVFLLSESARYVTGVTLPVDGGLLASTLVLATGAS